MTSPATTVELTKFATALGLEEDYKLKDEAKTKGAAPAGTAADTCSDIELVLAQRESKDKDPLGLDISRFCLDQKSVKVTPSPSEIKDKDRVITDRLQGGSIPEQLLVQPNVADDRDLTTQIEAIVNVNGVAASRSTLGTTIIERGRLGLLVHNGVVEVAGPGRWMKPNPRATWGPIVSLNESIQHETLTIVRVPKGSYGIATDKGHAVLLAAGMHVRNDRNFRFERLENMDQVYIHFGTIHVLRVPMGQYAKVVENNEPKLLKPGSYMIDSNFFKYEELADMNAEHIAHKTIHVVIVSKSSIALIVADNRPSLLYEGQYVFNTQLFTYLGMKDINENLIRHSTITRFRVKNGEIGCAWYKNKPVFIRQPGLYELDDPVFIFDSCLPATSKSIKMGSRTRFIVNTGEIGLVWHQNKAHFISTPGVYEVDDPIFVFEKCVAASSKQITLGSKMRIMVCDGEIGISYVKGKLDILQPNTYIFDTNDRIFNGFLSTQQQTLQLVEENSKDSFLRCDTKDFVEVGIKAAVFYRVCDPHLTLTILGSEEKVSKNIRETSIATLQGIMRSSALNQVAQSKVQNVADEKGPPIFFDKVHDEFIKKLHETYKTRYGIEIANIRIESFKIMNAELAKNISSQALTTASTETQLANLTGQREVATTQQQREAEVMRIRVEAENAKLKAETDAKSAAILKEAEAKARSIEMLAQAQANADAFKIRAEASAKAEAVIKMGEADARAIEMKSEAEKKRAENLNATEIGKELALWAVKSEMVTKSLSGIQKIVYLPSNGSTLGNPMQLFGLSPMASGLPGLSASALTSVESDEHKKDR